mmetsp:Transcript_12756/g.25989  ORF Transcript_12756/g.25989 Transcript_12756/m.25989 type:complete len:226 (+) Transcript_12756:65-742(+)|eukprot:CAMPEP_0118646430 /NCGR_PEP_ID=MMETSP0785-20121206/8050_1 /TAXON_ID=91992 /ORGANISM="Bolidomonas pacifica, Strain CCMP 1866" /LENGTH=225 /DNA_ID=CAMNT_0006538419 /DNA_START=176 /DNA_END=853 /DNA_ORIENTATION=-
MDNNEDMTVEDFLKARCLSLAGEINSYGARLEDKLREEFEEGKKELLNVHRMCVEGAEEEEDGVVDMDCNDETEKENDPSTSTSTTSTRARRSAATSSNSTTSAPTRSSRKKPQTTIHVLVEAGPHANMKAVLKPTKATAAMVGRSTGKKFREKGLSLSKDLEVSTTHGKFQLMKDGKIYFTDTGSTNGTFIGDRQLDEGDPVEITDDLKIRVGASVLRLSVITA